MTQTDKILDYLKSGHTLTPLEALDKFGCLRLGARIWDLNQQGCNVKRRIIKTGSGKSVAQYYLDRKETLYEKNQQVFC